MPDAPGIAAMWRWSQVPLMRLAWDRICPVARLRASLIRGPARNARFVLAIGYASTALRLVVPGWERAGAAYRARPAEVQRYSVSRDRPVE